MLVVLRPFCFVLLVIAGFAALGSIAAAGDIAYGVVYDCGPTKAKIKVFNCGSTMCNVLYVNEYSPGGGAAMSMSRETLEKTLRGEYGGGPCRAPGVPVLAPRTNANAPANTGAANTRTTGAYTTGAARHRGATTQAPAGGGGVAAAHYVCFYFTRTEGVNFTILGGGRYRDSSGAVGAYSLNGGEIAFRGAAFNGRRASYRPGDGTTNNPPTISFLSRGAEVDTCQPGQN